MRSRSIYESYLKTQLEAIVISLLAILMTIGCVLWAYRGYWESTRITYLHNQGVTLQIIDDSKNQPSNRIE